MLFRLPANGTAININNAILQSYADPKKYHGCTTVISKDWFVVLSSSGEASVLYVDLRKFKFD
jgi:hypothetical protein